LHLIEFIAACVLIIQLHTTSHSPSSPSSPQSQLFSGLFVAISFIAIYISAVFMQLNASNAFSSISPVRALLAEPQMSMPNSGGDMRGFYEIGQPKDWWHW
jgi:hypothetical protein